ncbi:flavin reductase family protein [Paenibacillus yanchengensis]|uniref:Flavin reductase family protein n=1 Tax=Paenibacillus yanchengensis TaxID=2035833 RepID=A0ABW4YHJ3_9BACL
MRSIDPNLNTAKENHKLLIGSVVPRPIAFVTSLSENGVLNGAPFSFFNIVSSNPPMISLSIQRSGGRQKDTANNITHTKEFVVHIVDEHNVEQINKTAASLLPDQSEVELAELTSITSTKIKVPGIQQAKVRMECKLEQVLELGADGNVSCDLVIGKVVQFHVQDDIYENGRINVRGLAAVSRLAGVNYAKIGDLFSLERPE